MANMQEWLNTIDGRNRDIPKTAEIYQSIKSRGLETVIWKEFRNIDKSILKIRSFIEHYKPCLFIYDPLSTDVKKGYLFNQKNIDEIMDWMYKNPIEKFSYLITSMIDIKDKGFIGSSYSDGKGSIFCETAHTGSSNHRTLSQSPIVNSENTCRFTVEDFEVRSFEGKYLRSDDIQRIVGIYSNKKGFFEFVYGEQNGRWGIYTTGIENVECPYGLKETEEINLKSRLKAINL